MNTGRSTPQRATPADLPAILAIDRVCFAKPWTEPGWADELGPDPSRNVWVLGDPALGLACAPIVLDVCELRRIAVVPEAQGRGHARDLLSAVIAHARMAGCVHIELEVAASNTAALALYRATGFHEVGRRAHYYAEPPADALLMTLELAAQSARSPG